MSKQESNQNTGRPPPLPPRQTSTFVPEAAFEDHNVPPPPYESVTAESLGDVYANLAHDDPRSRSTQSLIPSPSDEQGDRRKLLLVFIHGFMGNETSFQSFPAHVHSLVAALMAETHTVHTKIYPRYRSKKKIEFARDDFSTWLRPHEGPTTDVILLGHSMGGLLCAEVALMPSSAESSLCHRLIGTINFDVPFLGMHPRVVKVGLASVFNPAPTPSKTPPESAHSSGSVQADNGYFDDVPSPNLAPLQTKPSSSPFSPSQVDPNYNPAFKNDRILPARKGWEGAWYFINKHSSNLGTATKQLVKSHLEFGGAMADYSGLKYRYTRIRVLEEQNANARRSVLGYSVAPPRVRFVNYYTSSTGRPSKPKTTASTMSLVKSPSAQSEAATLSHIKSNDSHEKGPELSVHSKDSSAETDDDVKDFEQSENHAALKMDHLEPGPMSDAAEDTSNDESWVDATENLEIDPPISTVTGDPPNQSLPQLKLEPHTQVENDTSVSFKSPDASTSAYPPLPPVPDAPANPEKPPFFPDKETRKLAERDYDRALKLYGRALKDREKALKDREKLEKKREKQANKEEKKAEKEVQKEEKTREKDAEKEEKARKKTLERKESAQEETLASEQRVAQKEWNSALQHSWNEDDSTVEPHIKSSSSRQSLVTSPSEVRSPADEEQKPFKDRTFCALPPKDGSGIRDPTWVRVLMKDIDLVEAHCGLFFPDEKDDRYEKLIGDVGERICEWVGEAESERVARDFEAQNQY